MPAVPAVTVVRTAFSDLAVPTCVARECAALAQGADRLPDGVTPRRMMQLVRYYVDCHLPQHTVFARTTGFFREMPLWELRGLLHAAHALGAHGLLDHGVQYLARVLRGSSPEQILSVLGLNADTTAEEQRRRREEMGWAISSA